MLEYVSIMVMAYRNATEKSEEEALRDLAIDSFVCGVDLVKVENSDLLSSLSRDIAGVRNWTKTSRSQPAQ